MQRKMADDDACVTSSLVKNNWPMSWNLRCGISIGYRSEWVLSPCFSVRHSRVTSRRRRCQLSTQRSRRSALMFADGGVHAARRGQRSATIGANSVRYVRSPRRSSCETCCSPRPRISLSRSCETRRGQFSSSDWALGRVDDSVRCIRRRALPSSGSNELKLVKPPLFPDGDRSIRSSLLANCPVCSQTMPCCRLPNF